MNEQTGNPGELGQAQGSELSGGLGGACDHSIGFHAQDGGFLKNSEFSREAKRIREDWEARGFLVALKANYSDRQFVGDVYCMFRHCPDCGAALETHERK